VGRRAPAAATDRHSERARRDPERPHAGAARCAALGPRGSRHRSGAPRQGGRRRGAGPREVPRPAARRRG
jgi:hypothetical protein